MFNSLSSIWYQWRAGSLVKKSLVALALCIAPISANAAIVENKAADLSLHDSLANLDLNTLFKNAVRFIQVSNISDEDEMEIGKQINDQILSQSYQLYNNNQVQEYVNRLGQELVESSDSRDIPFTFQVVKSDEINAFAVAGGYVYVTTGLLEAADNRAQLASVVAHEIAHINKRHSVKAIQQATLAQGIAETAGVSTNTLAQIGYKLAVDLPTSREYEYEADSAGLNILQQAGYPPMAFVNFLKKLESGGQPEFLRTHPLTSNRIEAIASEAQLEQTATNKGQDNAAYRNNVLSQL